MLTCEISSIPPYAIGSFPSLCSHALAYQWPSLPNVRRQWASSSQLVAALMKGCCPSRFSGNAPTNTRRSTPNFYRTTTVQLVAAVAWIDVCRVKLQHTHTALKKYRHKCKTPNISRSARVKRVVNVRCCRSFAIQNYVRCPHSWNGAYKSRRETPALLHVSQKPETKLQNSFCLFYIRPQTYLQQAPPSRAELAIVLPPPPPPPRSPAVELNLPKFQLLLQN